MPAGLVGRTDHFRCGRPDGDNRAEDLFQSAGVDRQDLAVAAQMAEGGRTSPPADTRSRHATLAAGARSHSEHLMDREPAICEAVRGRSHIKPPNSGPSLADERHGLVPMLLEVGHPGPQCLVVVLSEDSTSRTSNPARSMAATTSASRSIHRRERHND